MYIYQLPRYIQVLIENALKEVGITGEYLSDAMAGKLQDIEYLFEEAIE